MQQKRYVKYKIKKYYWFYTDRHYTLKNQRLKITQLDKERFIKVNELKLFEVELF